MNLLTVNIGSSSVRLAVFTSEGASDGNSLRKLCTTSTTHGKASDKQEIARGFIQDSPVAGRIDAVVHRVVHGGAELVQPCLIDRTVEEQIAELVPLAPLHIPAALEWIEICRHVVGGGIPQIGAFDTAFFHDMPPESTSYALPQDLCNRLGIRRYGFHGLAHRYMWRRFAALRPERNATGRVLTMQLGSGTSITALRNGRPLVTSMGFTPLEGMVMATRAGDLDPGLVLYLADKLDHTELMQVMHRKSGLLGLSGQSSRASELVEAAAAGDQNANFALAVYCLRAKEYVGGYMAVLRGVDAIVFGGGVGENVPAVREGIVGDLDWCGIVLDRERNRALKGAEGPIHADGSSAEIWVLPVDEARELALCGLEVLAGLPSRASAQES